MAVFKCKMCGGDLEIMEGNVCECMYCGTTQTIPSGDDEKKVKQFNRANTLRSRNEFDVAAGVYEAIVSEFPEEAEAYWGLCLCRYGIEYVEDPTTHEMKPTCHRTEYESILNDSDYKQALEHAVSAARHVYEDEAKEIDRLQKEILEIVKNESPYDVFICYKETDENGKRTQDSVTAQDIYEKLTEKGYKVFFARITLEDKLGTAYEPLIFAALNSARVMLVVGTRPEFFSAVWVKNEWSRYLKMMSRDKSKYLFPCYANMDAYDIPKEIQSLQAQDLTKVGAVQDLVRNIGKIIPLETSQGAAQTAAAAAQTMPAANDFGSEEVARKIKQAFVLLSNKDYDKAKEFAQQAINEEPDAAEAYVAMIMANHRCPQRNMLAYETEYFRYDPECKKIMQWGSEQLQNEMLEYNASIAAKKLTKAFNENNKLDALDGGLLSDIVMAAPYIKYDNAAAAMEKVYEKAFALCSSADDCANVRAYLIEAGNGELVFPQEWLDRLDNKIEKLTGKRPAKFRPSQSYYDKYMEINGDDVLERFEDMFFDSGSTLKIPDYVKAIGDGVFWNKKKLKTLKIPDSVTKIGGDAFRNSGLTSLEVPDSVAEIGEDAFYGCDELILLTLPKKFQSPAQIEKFGIDLSKTKIMGYDPDDPPVKDEKAAEQGASGSGGSDSGLSQTSAADFVITSEGMLAAYQGSAQKVVIPDGVKSFGWNCFKGNEKIEEAVLPEGIETIASSAFEGCTSLRKVTFPSTLKKIEMSAFENCALEEVILPDGLDEIGDYAFKECPSLKKVEVPDSVTEIGENAFAGCTSLESFVIPLGVTAISEAMFRECDSLREVAIHDGVMEIGVEAFSGCSSLERLVIPDSVTDIAPDALNGCDSLKYLSIPAQFRDKAELDSIGITDTSGITIEGCSAAPAQVAQVAQVAPVPAQVAPAPVAAAEPAYTAPVSEPAPAASDSDFTIVDGVLTEYNGSDESVMVPPEVRRISSGAFCEIYEMNSVTVPDGVTSIGAGAFKGCMFLASVSVADSVTEIGDGAFSDTALEHVTLPPKFRNSTELRRLGVEGIEFIDITGYDHESDPTFSREERTAPAQVAQVAPAPAQAAPAPVQAAPPAPAQQPQQPVYQQPQQPVYQQPQQPAYQQPQQPTYQQPQQQVYQQPQQQVYQQPQQPTYQQPQQPVYQQPQQQVYQQPQQPTYQQPQQQVYQQPQQPAYQQPQQPTYQQPQQPAYQQPQQPAYQQPQQPTYQQPQQLAYQQPQQPAYQQPQQQVYQQPQQQVYQQQNYDPAAMNIQRIGYLLQQKYINLYQYNNTPAGLFGNGKRNAFMQNVAAINSELYSLGEPTGLESYYMTVNRYEEQINIYNNPNMPPQYQNAALMEIRQLEQQLASWRMG